MSRPSSVEIDIHAFKHNLQKIQKSCPEQKIMAVVKANGYGHGIIPLIPELKNVDAVGVCCLEEAVECRIQGLKTPILLMEGFFNSEELKIICEQDFQIVIHHEEQIEILEKLNSKSEHDDECNKENIHFKKPLVVWLKIDTGMNRLGIAPKNVNPFLERLKKIDLLDESIGLMTHFSDADSPNNPKTKEQFNRFMAYTKGLSGLRSCANSAAILAFPETRADWIRPGIMMYGISPFADKLGSDFDLKPVMTLTSQIIAIHNCIKGETIGYGSTWKCPEPMPIGVVAIGYGDGYPRHAKNGTPVLVNGKEVPLIGRVSMDMITIDLRSQPSAKIGDPVILWGRGLAVERIALCADTIPYELVCGVQQRLHRVLKKG